jgi:hypothetical protein
MPGRNFPPRIFMPALATGSGGSLRIVGEVVWVFVFAAANLFLGHAPLPLSFTF